MPTTARPRRSRFWRIARLLVLGIVGFAGALALAVLILELSQPVWELRVDGPPGTTFRRCVVEYPWRAFGYGEEGYSTGVAVPHVLRIRTTRLHPYIAKEGGPGPIRVTLLKNGVVVESEETYGAFGAPALMPVPAPE